MDARRRQWITWDVYFNTGNLGSALREEFGVTGMMVFNSFLCACKKNSLQGRISYTNDVEALAVMGLPGLRLRNEQGYDWDLDDFWKFLGRKKQVKRQQRGRITDVISTRWEHWQKPPGRREDSATTGSATVRTSVRDADNAQSTQKQHTKNGRSEAGITDELQTITTPEIDPDPSFDLDPESEREGEVDPDPPPLRNALDDAIDLHRQQQETRRIFTEIGEDQLQGLVGRLTAACVGKNQGFLQAQATIVVALCLREGPEAALVGAILEAETTTSKIKVPSGLFPIFDRHRVGRGLPAVNLTMPAIGKRAS